MDNIKRLYEKVSDFLKNIAASIFVWAKGIHPLKKFKSIQAAVKLWLQTQENKMLDLFSDNFYGVRLLKPFSTKLGYAILAISLYLVLLILPDSFLDAFSYINFTEQLLTLVTVLLTVLLSAGFVFLGDDTRGWSLARLTIIQDVVKLKGLIIAIVLICIISVLPEYQIGSYTVKEVAAPILIASYLFIFGIFIRVYRWLSDLAADPSLFENEEEAEARLFPSSSYRFARIVYVIHHNNRRDAWQSILERKIPEGYEEFIHEEFFKSADSIVNSMKNEKLQELSLMLEIYDKYYSRRNLNSWRFELDYTKKFLLLYSSVYEILHSKKPHERKIALLWRGQSALERIIENLIDASMSHQKIYSLFDAVKAYIDNGDLRKLDNGRMKDTKILGYFIDTLLENLYTEENLQAYDIDTWIEEKGMWQITYDNLYENKNNISFVMLKHFEEWLFTKLDRTDGKQYLATIDHIIELFFPDVDPIDFARLYWFKYNAKNTTDMSLVVDLIHDNHRPFGHFGRSYVSEVTGNKDDWVKEHKARQDREWDAGLKLFTHTSAQYFNTGFWDIDKFIEAAEIKIKDKDPEDDNIQEVAIILQSMKSIKTILKK